MAREAVIVDVDGTLAAFDPAVAGRWVLGEQKHWDDFFAHMADAECIPAIVRLVALLAGQGQAILICSGRPDSHRQHTEAWLARHAIAADGLYLRPDGADAVSDEEVKRHLLQRIHADGFAPWLVLDDRDAVVAQWRLLGLTCLQCAPGAF